MNDSAAHEARIPNPALAPLAFVIGRWRTVGTHPLVPGVTFHGQTTFSWMEGGAFLAMRSQVDEPQIPNGMACFGSDDALGAYFMLYFDERRVSRKYDVAVQERVLEWSREAPEFSQRFTITAAQDGRSMLGDGALRRAGNSWEPDLSLSYERVD